MGRLPRTEKFCVCVTPEEMSAIKEEAQKDERPVSYWTRLVILAVLKQRGVKL